MLNCEILILIAGTGNLNMKSPTPTTQIETIPIRSSNFLKRNINNLLNYFGYRLTKIVPPTPKDHYIKQRKLLDTYSINTIFDVGANIGQFGKKMRKIIDYKGRIISFEPLSYEYLQLVELSKTDRFWEAENIALGNEIGKGEIQVSGNSVCSSLLDMLPSVVEACSEKAKYIGKEKITIKTLDSVFDEYYSPGDNVFLKIDTQGYEHAVLQGAVNSLPNILGIQLELSFVPFYKESWLYDDMISFIDELGFKLMSIQPVLDDPETGRQLQVDGIFFRE